MKKILVIILTIAMLFCFAACGGSGEDEQGNQGDGDKEILKIGTSADYPPFEFYTDSADGKVMVGADIELANYIAEKLGVEIQIVDMAFDGLISGLDAGKVDMVIAGMSIDPDRKVTYSDPYYSAGQALLVPAGMEDAYKSLDELMGKRIGGQMGAIQEDLAKTYGGDGAQIVNNVQDMIMMVAEGKLDGMFCEEVVADSASSKSDKVVKANLAVPTEENLVAICVKQGNQELKEKIDPIIAEVKEKNLYGDWMTGFLDMEDAGKPE